MKPMDVERFLKAAVSSGKSRSYVSKARGMLFQIMRKAEANDLIKKNPVACAEKIKVNKRPQSKDSFTKEEVIYMMENLPTDRIGNSIRLMIGTGLRMQEMLAMQPEHIAEDGSEIYVRQAIKMVDGTPKIGSTKSSSSVRNIPVPVSIRKYAIMLRSTPQKFIWSMAYGRFCNPSTFRRKFKAVLSEIGFVRILNPHCCRHTYVSQLQAAGVDIETISSLTGHADVDMTEHYLHVQSSVKDNAAEKLDSLFVG